MVVQMAGNKDPAKDLILNVTLDGWYLHCNEYENAQRLFGESQRPKTHLSI